MLIRSHWKSNISWWITSVRHIQSRVKHARFPMSDLVYTSALENANYFQNQTSSSGKAFHFGFAQLARLCQNVTPLLNRVRQEAPKFDFDAHTPGNGYRSFLIMHDALFKKCANLCEVVCRDRQKMIFNLYKAKYIEDLRSWNEMLRSLHTFLELLNTLIDWSRAEGTRSLFPSTKHSSQELLHRAQSIDQYCFYGRHAGFQFCTSMESVLKGLLTLMAGYSDYYFSTSPQVWRVANSLYMGTRYSLDTEHRAKRIISVSQFATVDFCKSFWFLAESDFMKRVPQRLYPPLQVNQVIYIPPEPLQVKSRHNRFVDIPVPSAHGPSAPIPVRLLSAKQRQGMPGPADPDLQTAPSDCLIVHCHGGGFVAQSSQSHESYLRHWAVALDVPIASIDYSLAPEFPFPRQLQEILYVYAWILCNAHLLGTTAKKVIFAGDSAGANMLLSTTLWASDLNLPLPNGLFLAYVPLIVQFLPSPSRLLCLTDPLLPFGFMMRCLNAYAGHINSAKIPTKSDGVDANIGRRTPSNVATRASNVEAKPTLHNTVLDARELDYLKAHIPSDELDLFSVPHSPFLSPCLASDVALKKLPPISIVSLALDPCLDDSVEFAKRCRRLGCDISLDILPDLPHGFLNFSLVSPEAKKGSKLCVDRIRALMEKPGTELS